MVETAFSGIEYVNVPLPKKPCLAAWVKFFDIGDSRFQFRGAEFLYTLHHQLFIDVFGQIKPKLDGSHTVEEISSAVDPSILPTTVIFLLKILRAHGILQEGDFPPPADISSEELPRFESQVQFFSHFTQNPLEQLELLRQAKVALIGESRMTETVLDSFQKAGFNSISNLDIPVGNTEKQIDSVSKSLEGVDFLIACHQSTAFAFFETINSSCLKTGTRWLRVAVQGTTTILGPTIVPKSTACFICLCKRQESHIQDLEDFHIYKENLIDKGLPVDEGYFPPLWEATAAQASMEVVRIILGIHPPQTIGRFYEFKANSPGSQGHEVFRLPRCPACNVRGAKREAWNQIASLASE